MRTESLKRLLQLDLLALMVQTSLCFTTVRRLQTDCPTTDIC